jgi:hypothetical protein
MKYGLGDVFQKIIDDSPPDWRMAPYKYEVFKLFPKNNSYLLRNIVTHFEYLESEQVIAQDYIFLKKSQHP